MLRPARMRLFEITAPLSDELMPRLLSDTLSRSMR